MRIFSGTLKLQLQQPSELVLEEDGTVIDEDDILQEFQGKTLIVLERGQIWISQIIADGPVQTAIEPHIQRKETRDQSASEPNHPVVHVTDNITIDDSKSNPGNHVFYINDIDKSRNLYNAFHIKSQLQIL